MIALCVNWGCDAAPDAPHQAPPVAFEPKLRFLGDAHDRTRFACPPDSTVAEPLLPTVTRAGFVIDLPADAIETAHGPERDAAGVPQTRQAWHWQQWHAVLTSRLIPTAQLLADSVEVVIGPGDHDPVICRELIAGRPAHISATYLENWDPFGPGEAVSVWYPLRSKSTLHLLFWGPRGNRAAFLHMARSLRFDEPTVIGVTAATFYLHS